MSEQTQSRIHEKRIIVRPSDNQQALSNPNMGWDLSYYSDNCDDRYGARLAEDDQLEWFPGCTTVYFRTGWARVEPEEGKFCWDYTDRVAARWIEKGRQVAFCWIAFSTEGSVSCTPSWVREAGAKGWIYRQQWVPFWDDPVFVEKFGDFLSAATARYDGRPEVAYIEIGSLGTWGEGHTWTGDSYAPEITADTKKKHLRLWRSRFRRTPLVVNDEYGCRDSDVMEHLAANPRVPVYPTTHEEVIDYAASLGYGLADWSILVDNRSHEPTRRMAERIWRDKPVLVEPQHYGIAIEQGFWGDGSGLLTAVEEYHASHVRIHWWPDEFLNGNGADLPGNQKLVDRINRRLGYRLQLVEASWPYKTPVGGLFEFQAIWRNAGVAPCYLGGHPTLTLKRKKGGTVGVFSDAGFDVRSLEVGPPDQAPTRSCRALFHLPGDVAPGKYGVFVSVGDAIGTPRIALPLDGDDGERRYHLGEVEIVGSDTAG